MNQEGQVFYKVTTKSERWLPFSVILILPIYIYIYVDFFALFKGIYSNFFTADFYDADFFPSKGTY